MKNPVSTYRLQMSPEFRFEDLERIIDYLEALGISTVYSAPIFQARKGSTHGYDIIDPFTLNKEIGRLETFKKISQRLRQKKMNWLQDIVPNHMAFDGENVWLYDIFELGPASSHFNYFDIDWKKNDLQKVMTPFLGNSLDEVIRNEELQLKLLKNGVFFTYFDHTYPIAAKSYAEIFSSEGLQEWQRKFSEFSGESEAWEELRNFFLREVDKDPNVRSKITDRIAEINSSEEKLHAILRLQYFLPVHWKSTEKEINYRRFFTINDLICLRMEDEEVFENYHRFILELCEGGLINGLRVDHVDGLFDPQEYLERLRKTVGPEFYVIIEKILEWDEKLPVHWPVQGTSGYGFLASVNQLLTDGKGEEIFTAAYHDINPKNAEYKDLVYKEKLFILRERMGGEYSNLWQLALESDLLPEKEESRKALGHFLAAFPVYRIYPEEFPLKKKQKQFIDEAYQNAMEHAPDLQEELAELKKVFLGEADKKTEAMFYFLQRCQQFTGPLAAKGVEDTSFYIFNKLISHNEVGDSPENFGLSVTGFHERMQRRKGDFPLSINATATHDTKRGEDARLRINVLSEMGQEWFQKVKEWKEIAKKSRRDGKAPDANEEYFIFQMLLGAWPFTGKPEDSFLERTTAYLQKVLREAKEHSSWAEPKEDYENAVFKYVEDLIQNEKFLQSFQGFQQKICGYGAIKSLSQLVLKCTAPGIPDIYQGTELWDLSYVDPDNRRPVDYDLRKNFLSEIDSYSTSPGTDKFVQLKQNLSSGKIKMFCLHRLLELRKKYSEIFEDGNYLPIKISGNHAANAIAFARKMEDHYLLIIVPVLVTRLFEPNLNLKEQFQKEDFLSLSEKFPTNWRNIFTGETFKKKTDFTPGDLFSQFPVAVLTNKLQNED